MSTSEAPSAVQAVPVQPPEFFTRLEAAATARLKTPKHLDKLIRAAMKNGTPLPPKIKLNRRITLFPRVGFIEWLNQYQVIGKVSAPKRRRGRPRKPVARKAGE